MSAVALLAPVQHLKRTVLAALFVVAAAPGALAQPASSDEGQPFSSFGTPTSPAFTLLGVSALEVERPTTPADFAAKVSNATEQFSALPQQFAIEAAPYWLFSRSTFSWRSDVKRSPLTSMARTFNLSLGTAPIGTAEAPVTGVAVGFSVSPFSGTVSDQSVERIRDLERALTADAALFNERMRPYRNDLEEAERRELLDATDSDEMQAIGERYQARLEAVRRAVRAEIAEDAEAVQDGLSDFEPTREGLFVTLAGGAAGSFPEAAIDEGELAQWGFWGTFSYEKGPWSPIVVVRYLNRPEPSPLSNGLPDEETLDLGTRLLYTTGAFGLSAEYVLRRFFGTDDVQHRLVGAVEYNINNDLWLIASFGQDHDTERAGSLVAQLGLSFNLSKTRYTTPSVLSEPASSPDP